MPATQAYDDRTTQAVYSVLVEIGQVLGGYVDKFVVIGGSVPWLLYPDTDPKHIGTMDVDLSLDADALGDREYAGLIELLEKAGYERRQNDMRVFQMRRWVKLDDYEPIGVVVDLLMPREAKLKRNKPPILADFAVLKADGAGIAMNNFIRTKLSGTMPDGRENSVELRIASIPAFLVMKGYALAGRDKAKDAYDIYFAVRQFEGGAVALGKACRELAGSEVALEGYNRIKSKFRSIDDYGPETVKRFLMESGGGGGMNPDQIKRDAFMQVQAWIHETGL